MRISPAEHVIRTIGGVRKTARAIGRSAPTISSWRSPKGTAGRVPAGAQRDILAFAKKRGLDIQASDLILGRDVTKTPKTKKA